MVVHDFTNRAIIVTGALGRIGMATAKAFARGGARLMIADIVEASEQQLSALSDHEAEAVISCRCDMTQEADVAALLQRTLEHFGRVDVIANIAGAMIFRPVAEMTAADWHAMLAVNLVGPALLTGAGLKHLKPGGSIINLASIHARQTTAHVAGYAAAKAGLCSLTRSASIEGKPRGIRVNAVLPGAVDTPMLWNSPMVKSGAERLDPADVGRPEDIAQTICFLASDAAAFITGAEVLADGGRLARL